MSKSSVQIASPRHNLVQQTVCASYAALRCLLVGYAWRAIFAIIHLVVLSDRSQNVLQRGSRLRRECVTFSYQQQVMFIWKVCLENCGKDCAAAPKIQCCRLFAPTLPQNGRGIELQHNISAILCPFGNLITLSD